MESSPKSKIAFAGPVFWIYLIPLALSLAMLGVGAYLSRIGEGWVLLAAGASCVVIVLSTVPIFLALDRGHSEGHRRLDEMAGMHESRLRDLSVILNVISEQQLLSDRARAVAYRENNRAVLRRAISEELARKDFDSALLLVNDMEAAFGYKQEADQFRVEIEARRNEATRREVDAAMVQIDRLCREENWDGAAAEAGRIGQMFPGDESARGAAAQVKERQTAHKRQLLDGWRDALGRKDIDGSIEILKKLDSYLTPSEAAEIQEDARGVFRQRLLGLSDQFGQAVHQGKIQDAIHIGESIIRDFPNTRIAQEIRERMDVLKQRAEPAKT